MLLLLLQLYVAWMHDKRLDRLEKERQRIEIDYLKRLNRMVDAMSKQQDVIDGLLGIKKWNEPKNVEEAKPYQVIIGTNGWQGTNTLTREGEIINR